MPTKSEHLPVMDVVSLYHLCQLDAMPISSKDIAQATKLGKEIFVLYENLRTESLSGGKESQMTLQSGCIFFGYRVYIPSKYREAILNELHYGHVGIVKMKALARSFVYWPKIGSDIKSLSHNCCECQQIHREPSKAKTHL